MFRHLISARGRNLIVLLALAATVSFPQMAAAWTATIENKLDVDLTNRDIENRQSMQWKSKPPVTIPAGQSATFSMKQGTSAKVDRLKIKYTVGESNDWVEILIQDTLCTAKTSLDSYVGTVNNKCKGGSVFTYKAK
ncbi:hypothetical protein [Elongatibacter sediminis]|uniref:Uncharacterized protein n=1 Tax=Elongatibacter sediminis TaxID=3119006 RepID=A0AAW9RBH6_9GAMM